MYCNLAPAGFINVITFVIIPSGSYSLFHLAHSLEQIWNIPIRYVTIGVGNQGWDTSMSNQIWDWWRHAQDFDESQTLVTSGGFQGFSRKFSLSFEISKLWALVCAPFSPLYPVHHYELLENHYESLLVYY